MEFCIYVCLLVCWSHLVRSLVWLAIILNYEGETSQSARVRGAEHLSNFRSDRVDSALYKHKHNDHAHEDMKFSMHITKRFRDPLSRQANEAVRISGRKKGELLNSKNEFNHPPIARISVERNKRWKNNARNIQPGQ